MESLAVRRLQRLMRRMCFAALIATTANVARAEEAYQLKVVTDRADAIYETNATAKFLVTVTKGKQAVTEGKVSYIVDDFITEVPPPNDFSKGVISLDGEGVIAITSSQPGFLRCRVTFQTPEKKMLRATAGAGFSPRKIQLSLPVPDDFDEFWKHQKAQLAKVAMDAELTLVE